MKWVLGLILISALLFTACEGEGGHIEVVSVDYPEQYNVINYGRQVEFVVIMQNTGDRNCVLMEAQTPSFWNVDEPGLSGRYHEVIDEPLPIGEPVAITLHPYLRDGDIIQSWDKEFTMNFVVSDGCTIDKESVTGTMHIDIENSLLENDTVTKPVMVDYQ